MGASNKCVLLRFTLQLLYGFFLFGEYKLCLVSTQFLAIM